MGRDIWRPRGEDPDRQAARDPSRGGGAGCLPTAPQPASCQTHQQPPSLAAWWAFLQPHPPITINVLGRMGSCSGERGGGRLASNATLFVLRAPLFVNILPREKPFAREPPLFTQFR